MIYPLSSVLRPNSLIKNSEGVDPTSMNIPSISSFLPSLQITCLTFVVPNIFVGMIVGSISILGLLLTWSIQIGSAFRLLLLYIRYTFLAILLIKTALVQALSPLPTTITSMFLYLGPSTAVLYDTPFPKYFSSPGIPSFSFCVPTVNKIRFASKLFLLVVTWKKSVLFSID